MIKLMSALPNSLLAAQDGYTLTVTGATEEKVKELLAVGEWQSYVGHDSTAKLFGERLGLPVEANRVQVEIGYNESLIVGLFTPPHRLAEGQLWSEVEILAMPINWIWVQRHMTECVQVVSSDYSINPVVW